jgi:hypothetical protein
MCAIPVSPENISVCTVGIPAMIEALKEYVARLPTLPHIS